MCVTGPQLLIFNMKKYITLKNNKGFTLLFAVIVSTLVLAVGGSIINIALKQVILSGVGRDSQYAFYAANTGIECALYWDITGSIEGTGGFPTSTDFEVPNSAGCAGTSNIFDAKPLNEGGAEFDIDPEVVVDNMVGVEFTQSTFKLRNFQNIDGIDLEYCADVVVYKATDASGLVSGTRIQSRGYNTCDIQNPRRIERGLEMNY